MTRIRRETATTQAHEEFIVLASNPTSSSRKVSAIGTETGRTFKSERSAEKMKETLEKLHPNLYFLVLPIGAAKVPDEVRTEGTADALTR